MKSLLGIIAGTIVTLMVLGLGFLVLIVWEQGQIFSSFMK